MSSKDQDSSAKGWSKRRLILGALTIALLIFFTIPSIPSWWAVFHLPELQGRIQETENRLARAQDALEKLEANKLMSPPNPAAQEKENFQIAALRADVNSLQARLEDEKKTREAAGKKTGGGPKEWVRVLLEFGGLLGAFFHSVDAIKWIKSSLSRR